MTHLSLKEIKKPEQGLKEDKFFTEIGKLINKHRTSISDEIFKHKLNNCQIIMEEI